MSVETITVEANEEYEVILQQIDIEHAKQESLKSELKKINMKINATHLATKNHNETIKSELFYATVKIFDNLIDLIEFYGHNIRHEINNILEKDKDFYVIDLKLSQLLQNHILTKKWLINISILNQNSGITINKSISCKNNTSNRILSVTPIDKSISQKIINITLLWPNLNYWPILTLPQIQIDLSYYFRPYNNHQKHPSFFQLEDKITKYSHKIATNFSKETFLEVILKNSHHQFDTSNLIDAKVIKLQCFVDNVLEFDVDSKELKLQASAYLMKLLKEFFYKEMFELPNEEVINVKQTDKFKRDLEADILDFDQLTDIYSNLRN